MPKKIIKVYTDKKLTNEIEDDTFDFGIVEAGETKQFHFWILNDSDAYLKNLDFIIEHREVKVIKYPIELLANSNEELILEWSPSITLKEGLKARLRIRGIELWG